MLKRQGKKERMREAGAQRVLFARGHDRVLKVARTIADLAGADAVLPQRAQEAVLYRPRRA